MLSKPREWLAGRLVVEMGGRISVAVCGTLLAEAGATVVFVEPRNAKDANGKFEDRNLFAVGKRSLVVDPDNAGDRELLEGLLAQADLILTSSDWAFLGSAPPRTRFPEQASVCDLTALGRHGTSFGLTEPEVQALTGVAHSSGFADGGPTVLRIPVLEYSAAMFAAAGCAAALFQMRTTGQAQTIDVSLFNCAIHLLAAFLPPVFQGEEPGRYGNGHPLAAPWNAYPSQEGWILFCSASDAQWQKFCDVIGRPELALDEKFSRIADRAKNRDEVDAIVSAWSRQFDVLACIDRLAQAGLASGEIVTVARLPEEANVRHRRTIVSGRLPGSEETVSLPAEVVTSTPDSRTAFRHIPAPDEDRAWLTSATFVPLLSGNTRSGHQPLPLAGVRVIEIGQFTTAPLSARHLAMYGADIIKIEPPKGDAARAWAPLVDGISVFFSISNSGKTCYTVDLKSPEGLAQLEQLIRTCDVLIENLKPGSLAALGLGADRLHALNPRLVYCSISGFGAHSAYPGRPAFDTVVQAMSGIMDANAVDGSPLRAGVSVCDVMGGETALFAIIAALYDRQTSGKGVVLDLSMQDIAIWVTARLWRVDVAESQFGRMAKCTDGFVLTGDSEAPLDLAGLDREAATAMLRGSGTSCVPVRTIREAINSPEGRALNPLEVQQTAGGILPLLAPPLTMSPTALRSGGPPGHARPLTRALAAE